MKKKKARKSKKPARRRVKIAAKRTKAKKSAKPTKRKTPKRKAVKRKAVKPAKRTRKVLPPPPEEIMASGAPLFTTPIERF